MADGNENFVGEAMLKAQIFVVIPGPDFTAGFKSGAPELAASVHSRNSMPTSHTVWNRMFSRKPCF